MEIYKSTKQITIYFFKIVFFYKTFSTAFLIITFNKDILRYITKKFVKLF